MALSPRPYLSRALLLAHSVHSRAECTLALQEEASRVHKFVRFDDRKRSLVSILLQRACCARALGMPFRDVVLRRTRGGKPFLVRALRVWRSSLFGRLCSC